MARTFKLTFPALNPIGNPKEISMIQLATDPTASRMSYRPAQSEDEAKEAFEMKRGRSGHTWPFLSRYAERPVRQDTHKSTSGPSGS